MIYEQSYKVRMIHTLSDSLASNILAERACRVTAKKIAACRMKRRSAACETCPDFRDCPLLVDREIKRKAFNETSKQLESDLYVYVRPLFEALGARRNQVQRLIWALSKVDKDTYGKVTEETVGWVERLGGKGEFYWDETEKSEEEEEE